MNISIQYPYESSFFIVCRFPFSSIPDLPFSIVSPALGRGTVRRGEPEVYLKYSQMLQNPGRENRIAEHVETLHT